MNICLFSTEEWGKPLPRNDYRSIHMRDTLGLQAGDSLRIGLLGKGVGVGTLKSNPGASQDVLLEYPEFADLVPQSASTLRMLIGHPRPPVFQRLLKDLNSIGVGQIYWIRSALCEKSYLASKAWNPVEIEQRTRLGLEQGGRVHPAEVYKYYSLHRCLEEQYGSSPENESPLKNREELKLVLHPMATPPLTAAAMTGSGDIEVPSLFQALGLLASSAVRITLAIGPERGWTDDELAEFLSRGFAPVHAGNSILRTETAALISAGMAGTAIMDCQKKDSGGIDES